MSSKTNIIKRYENLRRLDIEMLEHPIFEEVKELYINNKIKSISSVKSYLKKLRVKKNGELYKTALNKLEKIKQMTDDLIEEQNQLRYIKEQEKIKQQREQEKQNKEFQENRTIEDFVEQINESFTDDDYKLSPLETEILKYKLLEKKHILAIKYTNRINKQFMTLSLKYIDGILSVLIYGHIANETATGFSYSDAIYEIDFDFVESIEIYSPDNVNFIDNKDGDFFNYLNTTELDLTRYQIVRKEDNINDVINEQCLIHCLKLSNIDESIINAVKLSMSDEDNINISYIPRSSLNKICDIIKHQINIHSYENKRAGKTTKKRVHIYGKKYETIINIAMYKSHFFLQEVTPYNKYFIDNYISLKAVKNGLNIVKIENDKYYKYGDAKCDSLYLINRLFKDGYFISDSSIIQSLVGSKVIKNISLDNLEQEQELYSFKEDEQKERNIIYADCESCVNGDLHTILMMGFNSNTMTKSQSYILNEGGPQGLINNFFNGVKRNLTKKGPPIIYFHNLKYDYIGLIKKYLIIKNEISKSNQIYGVKAFFNGFEFELRDSYKLIPIKLEKFPAVFGLSINKKEAISYKYYNEENIKLNKHSIKQYIESFEKDEDKELFKQIIEGDKQLFEYNEEENTFNAAKYYEDYLNYDCLVLKQGIEKYVKIIDEISSKNNKKLLHLHNSLTISSLTNKYMGINGAFNDVFKVSSNIREYISNAIYGGRVNACSEYKKVAINAIINDYDAVSLYPSAIVRMCDEMGIPTGESKKIINFNIQEKYFIGRFKITAINKKQQNPFIAIKTKNGLNYINELENNEPVIVTIDKITLEDYINFHHIEYEFIDGIYWDGGFNKKMGLLIKELFSSRIEYKQMMKKLNDTSDDYNKCNVLQEIIKLMMNSSYGKTILKKTNEKTKFINNSVDGKTQDENINNYICNNFNTIKSFMKISDNQTQIQQETIDISYNLAHVGVLILSYSKRIMNEIMGLASDNNIDIYYQDTDSMHLKNEDISKLESLFFNKYNRQIRGDNLGQFHSDFKIEGSKKGVEVVAIKSLFLGKKSYIDKLESLNEAGEKITGYHMRLKGISTQAIEYAVGKDFNGDYFKLYEYLSTGQEYEFILNPYVHSVSFEYVKGGIRSRGFQEFKRVVKF